MTSAYDNHIWKRHHDEQQNRSLVGLLNRAVEKLFMKSLCVNQALRGRFISSFTKPHVIQNPSDLIHWKRNSFHSEIVIGFYEKW